MLRFILISLLTINLTFALPTVSYITTITERSDNASKLVERAHKYRKPHKYHTYTHTTTTPVDPCPTGTAYYIQAAENNQYARLQADDPDIAPDSFSFFFDQDTTSTAVSVDQSVYFRSKL